MTKSSTGRAPVSVTFIVRDRSEAIARAVASIRPHVSEIVIVDTGSRDDTPQVAKRLADRFKRYDGCNNKQTGLIEDFSDARNYALSLAREEWAMWMDSDDTIEGGENIAKAVRGVPSHRHPTAIYFPYRDSASAWTWMRERLVSPASDFRWTDACHETLGVRPGKPQALRIENRDITMIHHREEGGSREAGRNLRILRAVLDKHGFLTPRQQFYIGREHADLGHLPEAIRWLRRCTDSSGWEDERAAAHMQLSDLYLTRFDFDSSLHHSLLAHATKEQWAEPLVKIARVFYMLANRQNDRVHEWREHIRRCAHFCERAVASAPAGKLTTLFIDPAIATTEVRTYGAYAKFNLGDTAGALAMAEEALSLARSDNTRTSIEAHIKYYRERMPGRSPEPEPAGKQESAAAEQKEEEASTT